ncbi:MAG: DUF192 domain-containing protein [Candidatus Micrarchaeia archaeon]
MCITLLLRSILHYSFVRIKYKNHYYKLYLSDTPAKHMLGLMHLERLEQGVYGMLFDFKRESRPGIWMHNMRFSIDILWLDTGGSVVHIVRDAAPCTSIFRCKTYTSPRPARYVIELKAGASKSMGIEVGSKIEV